MQVFFIIDPISLSPPPSPSLSSLGTVGARATVLYHVHASPFVCQAGLESVIQRPFRDTSSSFSSSSSSGRPI
jgi:hypothetical protein